MNGEQAVEFVADGNRLHGMLAIPPGARLGAVVCHPHPSYGGTMDNNVVRAVTDPLQTAGVATLRFNFRGVPPSEGEYGNVVGECEDTRAAIRLLLERAGLASVTLAGYSFGSIVALQAGAASAEVDRLAAIAPPLSFFDVSFLLDCHKPKLFLVGDRDEYCPVEALEDATKNLPDPTRTQVLPGADHFFGGFEIDIGRWIAPFASKAVETE